MLPLSPLRRPPRREGTFAVQLLLFQFRKQFDYVNYNGLEDFWTYHNQNIGRAVQLIMNMWMRMAQHIISTKMKTRSGLMKQASN